MLSNYDFTGSEIELGEAGHNTLLIKDNGRLLQEEPIVLKENEDYKLSYKNNLKAGTATVTINGMGGYTGSKKVTFKINKVPLTKEMLLVAENAVYTKSGAKPVVRIFFKDAELILNKDYTISYRNNKQLGENSATVTISGKGNFAGKVTATYSVVASDKENVDFSVEDIVVPSSLSRLKPKITVKEKETGIKLTSGKDYEKTIEYYVSDGNGGLRQITKDDLQADVVVTARLTLKSNGAYDSDYGSDIPNTIDCTFRFYNVKTSSLQVDKIPTQSYTGKEIRPAIVVKKKDGTLLKEYDEVTKTGDYVVIYSNNIKVGTAKIKIVGVNNQIGGTKTVTFKISKKVFLWRSK